VPIDSDPSTVTAKAIYEPAERVDWRCIKFLSEADSEKVNFWTAVSRMVITEDGTGRVFRFVVKR
jgi:hypothetical protein